MSIKSVHITNYYHKNSGGISTSYNALLAAAGRHKRLMRLIVPGETEIVEEVNEYAKIYYVPAKQSPVFDKRYRIMMPWQYMLKDSIIRKILLKEMPQMIEVTDKYTLSMMGAMIRLGKFKQLNRPMLVHFSCERMDDNIGSFLSGGNAGKWLARRIMGNYNLPSFDFHIANSPYTADEFYQAANKSENPRRSEWFFNKCRQFFKSPRVPLTERIHICPRGVDIKQFSPSRKSDEINRGMRRKANIPEDAIILLYAGRISPEKNIGLLPDLMEVLAKDKKDYRLLAAGAGPKAEWLQAETDKRIPNKIIQLGHLDKETLANYYANCDVFVHPNPKEPFGIAPLEAMASGTPTVAPNAGGLLSYATDENMWLAEPKAENFAAAIREIIENPELTKAKITKALETAEQNTREASTDFLIATYDKLYEDFQKRNELFI
ncbi:glycosyltransferase family 1 protein [soil metagenome]